MMETNPRVLSNWLKQRDETIIRQADELNAKNDAIYRLESDNELLSREIAGMRIELRELRTIAKAKGETDD